MKAKTSLAEEIDPPTIEEIRKAIKRLRNNRAAGTDNIQAELLKYGGEVVEQKLGYLISLIWKEERIPEEWNNGIICPIYKKGDQLECSNYRGITLLNLGYKILFNYIFDKLQPVVDKEIGRYQCGFRSGKSTIDQIFCLRQILERTLEFGIGTHQLFIDYKAAYDNIIRSQLYCALREMNIPDKLVRMIEVTMSNVRGHIKLRNSLSEPLNITNGLRQGDALSCLLFNVALEKVIRDANLQIRGTIFFKSTQILAYADDLIIIARSFRALEDSFIALIEASKKMGLTINIEKTKYMACGKSFYMDLPQKIKINQYEIEQVNSFRYLGSVVSNTNDIMLEINARLVNANRAYFALSPLFRSKLLSLKTKFIIYKTLIVPILDYASETWPITANIEKMLNIFERKVLRRIIGPIRERGQWRKRYNKELYGIYGDAPIINVIRAGRIRWAGHLMRMDNSEVVKRVLTDSPGGSRSRGRPKTRWLDGVEEDLRKIGCRNWKRIAQDRKAWRKVIEEVKVL